MTAVPLEDKGLVFVVECLPTRAFLGSSPLTIKIRVRDQGSCSSFVDPSLGSEHDLPRVGRAERSCQLFVLQCPHNCLRHSSLMFCPRSRQCGTQEGTCAEVWKLGLQSGGIPKPPLSQAIHWPDLPPQHTHQGWSPAAPLLAVSLQPRRWRSTG